jgi:hypothetical protein
VRVAQGSGNTATDAARDTARESAAAAREAAAVARDAAREAAAVAREAAREAARTPRRSAINVELPESDDDKAGRKRGVRINVDGMDREYDSFDQFLDRDPALAAMVLGIIFIVFLTPILLAALVIWYKIRKNRMLNETMLRLAEKGIVTSPDAMEAVQSGQPVPASGAAPAAALFEHARAIRNRAAWSDLRKGVIMGAIGLALTLYSIIDGEANWIGLVLLFVGLGYGVLWTFETRHASSAARVQAAPGPGDFSK